MSRTGWRSVGEYGYQRGECTHGESLCQSPASFLGRLSISAPLRRNPKHRRSPRVEIFLSPTTTEPLKDTVPIYIMASSFEPSLSTSGVRPPLASADAPSMADSLPSINFGFEDLRNRMAQFTAKFDAFIERGRKQVLEERNQFHINLAELQGTLRPFKTNSG